MTDLIRPIRPDTLPVPAGHYSPAVVANGMVFVSGQLPVRADGTMLVDAPFEDQVRQILENIRVVLDAAGSAIDHLVQVRVYLTDMSHWPEFNALYAQWVGSARPARAVVPCGTLHHGVAIEVEAVGIVQKRPSAGSSRTSDGN